MTFLMAHHTDKGIQKKTNQDALLMKTADTAKGKVGLFVVCDGMGGLSHGELASATVVKTMSDWFDEELPGIIFSDNTEEAVVNQLTSCILGINEKIIAYGKSTGLRLGTTITALLIVNMQYYLLHIGDSRAYHIREQLRLLTKDQTLAAREVAKGNLTEEEARTDPRKNVLLQCIGATKTRILDVSVLTGAVESGAMYLLCSDGFHHRLSDEELLEHLYPGRFVREQDMKKKAVELIELVKNRQETDNISALLIKII
ncbi:Serine/threonine protein phosphatase PrpC [Evansella caseinilytica]|uniref:Serine/threonine protein phosphatase PrpC n=1 Tax=Evansella caseinilytica TaxID=1503961 RepID=A0A1H3RZU1_9BACI|nr:protein phosphatase 2C domain-containing protein [Evansella caseinilytica]SDZ30419.1 Serine/threonine protein phosphatase PrpC [Evansella caseinilytica]